MLYLYSGTDISSAILAPPEALIKSPTLSPDIWETALGAWWRDHMFLWKSVLLGCKNTSLSALRIQQDITQHTVSMMHLAVPQKWLQKYYQKRFGVLHQTTEQSSKTHFTPSVMCVPLLDKTDTFLVASTKEHKTLTELFGNPDKYINIKYIAQRITKLKQIICAAINMYNRHYSDQWLSKTGSHLYQTFTTTLPSSLPIVFLDCFSFFSTAEGAKQNTFVL